MVVWYVECAGVPGASTNTTFAYSDRILVENGCTASPSRVGDTMGFDGSGAAKEGWLAVAVQTQLRSRLATIRSRRHRLHSRELDLKLKGRRNNVQGRRKKERGREEEGKVGPGSGLSHPWEL